MNLVDLNQRRAKEREHADDWTPLDALKRAIELIESGVAPAEELYVAMSWRDGEKLQYSYVNATANHLTMLGLLTQHLHDLMQR